MSRMIRIVWVVTISVIALVVAFSAGRSFERYLYEDICLDLGGGRNPGEYPICVITGNR